MTISNASTRMPSPAAARGIAAPAPPPDTVDSTSAKADPNHRSGLAATTVGVAMGAGVLKGLLFDRVRVLTAIGHNTGSKPQMGKWAGELISGKITNDVVPISGGVVKLGRWAVTENGFGHSYRISNGVGLAITMANLTYAAPNLIDGFQNHGGWSGLLDSRSGRTGVFGLTANLSTIGMLGVAFARAPKEGGLLARMGAALGAGFLSSNKIVLANMIPGAFATGNELGAFDWLNKDGHKSFAQSMSGVPGTAVDKAHQGIDAIGGFFSAPFS